MRIVLLVIVVALISHFPAQGITDPTPNLIGLYFDEQADEYCREGVAPFSTVFMHALLTNGTEAELQSVEFGIDWPANVLVVSSNCLIDPFWDPVEYVRYLGYFVYPVEPGPIVSLFRFQVLYMDTNMEPAFMYLRQADQPTGPWDVPGLTLPDGTFVPTPYLPFAQINGQCTVDAEASTWDAVRAIYR
jgi:hypothetical protein